MRLFNASDRMILDRALANINLLLMLTLSTAGYEQSSETDVFTTAL